MKKLFKKKDFALFFDEKGELLETINITNKKDKFNHNKGFYLKNKNKFDFIPIKNKNYFLYTYKCSNPINFISKQDEEHNKFIAEQVYSIVETNILKDVNRIENSIFANLNPKQVMIGVAVVIGIIYFITTGGI